ncbi:hypothetical protein B9Z55_007725 [Caenorhabditis nigoni]|uniref:Uncharacterized protein n=1 Tax=Caenorhabditis nigoni TaxID=1611254 RepID=A0A2G5VAY7_9PELO|nr:hypothetical protein B9Z55_007725 [Caenorhabditis nigoni]
MASSVEDNIGKVPESTVVLEKMEALEKLMQAVSVETKDIKNHYEQALEKVSERINKENQRKFDQLSDRLQSIEAAIGKISKSIEDAQKSNDVSEKEPIEEPTVSTNVSLT